MASTVEIRGEQYWEIAELEQFERSRDLLAGLTGIRPDQILLMPPGWSTLDEGQYAWSRGKPNLRQCVHDKAHKLSDEEQPDPVLVSEPSYFVEWQFRGHGNEPGNELRTIVRQFLIQPGCPPERVMKALRGAGMRF